MENEETMDVTDAKREGAGGGDGGDGDDADRDEGAARAPTVRNTNNKMLSTRPMTPSKLPCF